MNLKQNRRYRSGMGFAFWRWTDVYENDVLYLRRLHIIQVPTLGAIMVHWIMKPDLQPDLHDHPVDFFSILLRGWYQETTPIGQRTIQYFNFKHAEDFHRITALPYDGVTTLVFAGPKRREWGYHTSTGWTSWKDYTPHADS